jgi:hypothetical protein
MKLGDCVMIKKAGLEGEEHTIIRFNPSTLNLLKLDKSRIN